MGMFFYHIMIRGAASNTEGSSDFSRSHFHWKKKRPKRLRCVCFLTEGSGWAPDAVINGVIKTL